MTTSGRNPTPLPTVTIVFLVFNRRDELRTSLEEMARADYPADLLDIIVVDNASGDGASEMVRDEFPDVRLIRRQANCGVSGWNDGFAAATGDWILALDDDCYLPGDALLRAVTSALKRDADLVSFGVSSLDAPDQRANESYRTGLLSFWGCAVLARRRVFEKLVGYDPQIFVWANELEFMVRFFDAGFCHLHAPEIVAVHMKELDDWRDYLASPAYRVNAEHFAYIAGKLLRPRDAAAAIVAILAVHIKDAVRADRVTLKAMPRAVVGFARGLRHRQPVNPFVSRVYRRNFESFASPWWLARPASQLVKTLPRELADRLHERPPRERPPGRTSEYYEARRRYHPKQAATLRI